MPGLVRKLAICATADGVLLRPVSSREDRENVCISYGANNNKIVPTLRKEFSESDSTFIEAHGVVGILNLVATSYLITITRREQIAQIQGKAIYAIRDVTLIPLSSQVEAEKSISAAEKTLKHTNPVEIEQPDESDIEDDVDSTAAGDNEDTEPAEAAALEPPKSLVKRGTSVFKNVVQDKGKYGRFATRWFSKGGGASGSAQSSQEQTIEESPTLTQQQSQPPETASKDDKDTTAGAEQAASSEPDAKDSSESENKSQTITSKSNIESLTPRILRSARLYFSSSGFYFSFDHDLSGTLTQKSKLVSSVPLWQRFDSLFFWNRHLVDPFIKAGRNELVLPLLQGFVGQRAFSITKTEAGENDVVAEAVQEAEAVVEAQSTTTEPSESTAAASPNLTEKDGNHEFLLTMVSRRSIKRAGLRYMRRGVDDDGNVANTVETEQTLSSQSWSPSDKAFSLVQVRGSLPLHFSQSPYSFKPLPVMFGSEATNQSAFRKHFEWLSGRYGQIQIASLVDKHGPEVSIGEAFEHHTKQLNENGGLNGRPVEFEWFDFHAACKGMKFENVSILMNALESTLKSFGWVVKQDDRNIELQKGVLRTNCMDCLDRTNVTQSAVAGWALQQQLAELGLNIDLQKDPKTQWFNTLWADNGDAISKQYAGTAALKGDFTRTRKRNWTGALSDFSLSLNRYYNNIFGDYFLQTCIDYYLGNAGPAIFDEFETEMMSKDYALDMRRIRQNGIDTCVKIVLEDPKEHLIAGWTLSCPKESNTLRTLPFEECVVLLTDTAFYFCRFDWDTEKVGGFERVELIDITDVWRGAYITSALGPTHLDEKTNVGFAVRCRTTGNTIVRTNTRSPGNEAEPLESKPETREDDETDKSDKKDESEEKSQADVPENKILAFKALPPETSAARDDKKQIGDMIEPELVQHICDEVQKAREAAFRRDQGAGPISAVEEKDVISEADAKRSTGYMESIGYSLKRLVWS